MNIVENNKPICQSADQDLNYLKKKKTILRIAGAKNIQHNLQEAVDVEEKKVETDLKKEKKEMKLMEVTEEMITQSVKREKSVSESTSTEVKSEDENMMIKR